MYDVTVNVTDLETAQTIRTWLDGGRFEHRSNFLFVVRGSLGNQSHNNTFLICMAPLIQKGRVSLMTIVPTKGA